jgi:hypothetical protein
MTSRHSSLAAFVAALLCLWLGAAGGTGAAASRVVAVGDVHGALERFAAILQKAQLIDAQRRWVGGKAVLVQTGDIADRGVGMRATYDFVMALEAQARSAGGRVHMLLGNHEVMNMAGELRDAGPEIFETFGGEVQMREAFSPRGRYGRWLRGKKVIESIDGSIFLHGGINPEFSTGSVDDINRRARREMDEWDAGVAWLVKQKRLEPAPKFLDAVDAANAEIKSLLEGEQRDEPETRQALARLLPVANIGSSSLFHPDGPLWFRGFNGWGDEEGPDLVAKVLKQLRGQRVVSGHSVQQTRRITERFGGRVFLIDTGMLGEPFFPNGRASALEISGGAARPIYLD